jgi:hypothetical protein
MGLYCLFCVLRIAVVCTLISDKTVLLRAFSEFLVCGVICFPGLLVRIVTCLGTGGAVRIVNWFY